jgi:hypothetical protein
MRSMALLQLQLPSRIWLRWQGCIVSQMQRLRSKEIEDVLTALAVSRSGRVEPRCVTYVSTKCVILCHGVHCQSATASGCREIGDVLMAQVLASVGKMDSRCVMFNCIYVTKRSCHLLGVRCQAAAAAEVQRNGKRADINCCSWQRQSGARVIWGDDMMML